ncbi:M16 family metallopeptidase [Variovorax sp. PBL-E5]|uniref:M16 family metallopeptidase n=1 Tax=Variovorax sp. PBL-E5 TaxID=434014 RepID=UPI0013178885|nr:pitrilysin family protein [Variovorax sp. PBL-E5]VTU36564.1 Peptidase M16 inactive domain protein [Variovorax sp. PBL-E5]
MFTPRQLVLRVAFAGAATVLGAGAQAAIPIQHWTLPNGAKIYLAATRVLPIVDVELDFDAGSRRDPAAQSGLAEVSAEMVEKGVLARGSDPAMDQNALGEAWADLGANFDVGAGADRTSFTLRSLSDPALLGKAVQLAAREIGEPAFPADVWARERERLDAAIKEANTKPATIAGRAFSQAIYGTHPYGFDTTEETLARIDVDAMRQRYQRLIVPCRAKLSIVGAVTRQQAEDIATTLLSRLPPADATACAALPAVPEVAPLTAPKEERIPFDSAQTHVLIGEPGYKRTDPDHFALTVGNYILGGGGFVSRLTDQVREKRGLTYSVYSTFSPGLHAGAFRIAFQTRPDQVDEAVKVSREVLAKFVADGPTEAELKAAKDNLIGGFPLLLDSNRKLLGNIANIAWNDLPLDYLDTWIDRMNAVTVADIKAAFQRKLQPDRMVTVIVGAKP